MNFSKHWAATLEDYVIDLAWSPDGSLLAAASAAGGISLFGTADGAVRHVLAGHENGTNTIAWKLGGQAVPSEATLAGRPEDSPDVLVSGGQDGCVRFWDAVSGRPTAEAKLGSAWVEHLAAMAEAPDAASRTQGHPPCLFAAAGKKLFALRADGSVAHAFPDAPKTITALASFTPRESVATTPAAPSRLAAAYFGGVCIWNTDTLAADKELPYGNTIHALTWSPDGRWLVAGCQDNAVHLWVPAEDLELHMSGYETKLRELSFSQDSRWLATGGGRDACVWDCAGAGPEGREPLLLPHDQRVVAVAFQHRHGLLATAAGGGEFSLWSPTRKNPLVASARMPAAATKLAWSPDDTLLAVGTEKGAVYVFKVEP